MPWEDIAPTSMPWFLDHFTLHDSGLQSVAVDGRTLLEIGFDLHWNRSIPEGQSNLWIRFDRPYQVTYTQGGWSQPTLEGAESVVFDKQLRDALRVGGSFDRDAYQHSGTDFGFLYPPDDDTLTRTVFQLVSWGRLELLHAAPVRFAVGDLHETVVDLTTLAAGPLRND